MQPLESTWRKTTINIQTSNEASFQSSEMPIVIEHAAKQINILSWLTDPLWSNEAKAAYNSAEKPHNI